MQKPSSSSWSFQTRVLIPVLTFLFLVPVVTLWVMQHRMAAQFERDAEHKLKTAERVFKSYLEKRSDYLYARYRNLVQEPRFRAMSKLIADTQDFGAVKSTVDDFLRRVLTEFNDDDAQVMLFTSANDTFLPVVRAANLRGENFHSAARELIAATIADGATNKPVVVDRRLYNAVSVPVAVNNATVGALTVFVPIADAAAREFASQTGADFALFIGDALSASTMRTTADFDRLRDPIKARTMQKLVANDAHYFAFSGEIPALPAAEKVSYVLLSSYEEGLRELRDAQKTIWFLSLAGILVSAGIVLVCVRRATGPLRRLREIADAVGRGDFSRRLSVTSADEFGALGHAFNQMSANLQTSRAELEKTLDSLKNTQTQLIQREKLSAVGEFVAGVAHELNNPLTSLIGFAQLLEAGGVDDKQKSHLNFIVKSSQRCHKIVQSLLSFARQHAPERTILKVSELLDSVMELLAYEMRTSNIQLLTRYDSSLPLIVGDSHQLQQVILNILNNARQAILATQKPGNIRITTVRADHLIRITICDDGPGISAENLQKIFDPFFTTKPVGQGTGLGLSLCYGIVKEHGGSIHCASKLGEGAAFVIDLPAASASQLASVNGDPRNEPAADSSAAGKRILIIDDEEWILTMTRTVLEEDGYVVDVALDGDAALSALAHTRYDLLVCDQKMPGLSGSQLFRRLQIEDPETADRLIFMTGDVVGDNFQSFLKETRKTCLAKPFSLTQLRATVAGAITNS